MGRNFSSKVVNCLAVVTVACLCAMGSLFGQAPGARSQVVARLNGAAHQARPAATKLGPSYSLLYSFQCQPDGENPVSGLTLDSSGNLYGTTEHGGTSGLGTVYRVTPAGAETVLFNFSTYLTGYYPYQSGVVLDSKRNMYGIASAGTDGYGVVYELTPAGKETVLYNFTGGPDGGYAVGTLARNSTTGALYGAAYQGGALGDGVVFRVTSAGKESVLYNFGSAPNDGHNPQEGLTRDSTGTVYGTTGAGGTTGNGTVFKVSPSGKETVLHSFAGSPGDGARPWAPTS